MILVFLTEDGRRVYDEQIVRDAADATMGDMGIDGTAGRLAFHVDYYSEGNPLPTNLWANACDTYAKLREDYWNEHDVRDCDHRTCRIRAAEQAAIRAWPMPPSIARLTAQQKQTQAA